MPTITETVRVTTDANGSFTRQETFNPPGPFSLSVSIIVKLVSPVNTVLTGTVDVDADDGSPQNPSRDFSISSGQDVSLGTWNLDGGNNKFVTSGQTSPVQPNTEVVLEVRATL